MSFNSAKSMPRNCVETTACEGKGIPSAPPKNSRKSSSSSTDISQAWQSPSFVEGFQTQFNCAPRPMSLHNKDANKNAAPKPTQMVRTEKMVKTTFFLRRQRSIRPQTSSTLRTAERRNTQNALLAARISRGSDLGPRSGQLSEERVGLLGPLPPVSHASTSVFTRQLAAPSRSAHRLLGAPSAQTVLTIVSMANCAP